MTISTIIQRTVSHLSATSGAGAGVACVRVSDGASVTGVFGPRKEDPVALQMEGAENVSTPNRYHLTAVDLLGVLLEGQDYTIAGETYRIVDIDTNALNDGNAYVRATFLKLGDA